MSDTDRGQLDQMLQNIERKEWAMLRPALDTMRHEQTLYSESLAEVQAQNAILSTIAEHYEDLLACSRTQLAGLLNDRETLRAEFDRAPR